ncbi:probable Peroxiredoxin HYR1 [Hanseniaspora guilliermondii]|uniref:Glutathione peroxidase n=1 Tax=Hanseniaspora guilliermondii TaxID=56406 RepID=A0A1L0CLI1_9ASCO|nr:probable Peroxiredoxin HYR1 [Hanseniaspora guilliermondii]
MSSFYDLTCKDGKGEEFSFQQLKGKVVLIFNSASKCGFTKQLDGLENLNKKYKDQGLVVIGFPCNQFAGQEPGSNDDIVTFCKLNYGVSFQMMDKIDVNGDKESPVYKYLKSQKSGLLGLKRIKWNFEKFLINKEGEVVSRYASTTSPESLENEIESLLK